MSDEQSEGQENTDAPNTDETSSEGNLLTEATDTTTGAEEGDNHDDQQTDTNDENDGSSDDGEGDGDDQNEGAPEEYGEFDLPEGFEALDETLLAEAAPLFKESGLSQKQAQKFIDIYAKTIQSQSEARSQAFTDWNNKNVTAIKEHPEFGGDKLDKSLISVARTIDTVMGDKADDFRDLLNQTGLGNEPLMFELLTKVGRSVGEDGFITGGKANVKKSVAETMYGKDGTGVGKETET